MRTGKTIHIAHLFIALPLAAAFLLTALPDAMANQAMPLSSPAFFLLISFLVFAITLWIMAALLGSGHDILRRPLLLPCVFLLLIGEGLFLLRFNVYPDLEYLTTIAAVLIGAGSGILMMLWGRAYCMLPRQHVLSTTALSFALAGIIVIVLRLLQIKLEATALAVVLVLISAVSLESILIREPKTERKDDPQDVDIAAETPSTPAMSQHSAAVTDAPSAPTTLRRFAAMVWKPFFGALLCFTIIACRWGTALGTPGFSGAANHFLLQMASMSVAGVVVLILTLVLEARDRVLERCLRLTPIVAAAILLVSWFFTLISSADVSVCLAEALTGLAYGFMFILAWYSITVFSQEVHEPSRFFCVAGTILFVDMVVFAFLGIALVDFAQFVVPILTVAYLVLANFDFGSDKTPQPAPPTTATVVAGTDLDERLAAISENYHLSPREAEVLPLLAQGHSANYIADTLCISFNTVKTHTRRVYEKLDVHTRDELITLIDSEESAKHASRQ